MTTVSRDRSRTERLLRVAGLLLLPCWLGAATPASALPQPVIVDTDIGDDIDDAFALALVLRSPSLQLDAVSTSFGDTRLRARLVARLLADAGRPDIPIYAGPPTRPASRFTQAAFAASQPSPAMPTPDAVDGVLQRLRDAPDKSITLLALAPLTTVGAMIRRDPVSFARLKQVVMMGGWIRHGYPDAPVPGRAPVPEYNIALDPADLRALLGSGVPVVLMPLDATLVPLRPSDRASIVRDGRLGHTLGTLFRDWYRTSPYRAYPTLFDVVPVAWLLQPSICTPQPMRLTVTDAGYTRPVAGPPNVSACLSVDTHAVQTLLDTALHP